MRLAPNPYGPYIVDNGPDKIPANETAIFVPKHNEKRADATGTFHIAARDYSDYWDIPYNRIYFVNNHLPRSCHKPNNVADHLLDQMENMQAALPQPIAVWVFLCHGYSSGIQFSIRSKYHRHFDEEYEKRYERFVDIISEHPSPVVVLYCCSTSEDPDGDPDTAPGSGDNSFGDLLRDDLCKRGCIFNRVFTHSVAGHTLWNARVKILDGDGSPIGAEGGKLVTDPGTQEYKNLRRLLKTDFAFKIPFMTKSSIQEAIK